MPSKLRQEDGTFLSTAELAVGGTQGDAVADLEAITATDTTAPAAYAAVVNMTDPVAKAEGEAVSAALAALRASVAAYELQISALVVDVTNLHTTVAALKASLEAAGVLDT